MLNLSRSLPACIKPAEVKPLLSCPLRGHVFHKPLDSSAFVPDAALPPRPLVPDAALPPTSCRRASMQASLRWNDNRGLQSGIWQA